jgi:hypothetical protein
MIYKEIAPLSPVEIGEHIKRGKTKDLVNLALAAALHWPDAEAAQQVCFTLARHKDAMVRGNAVLALGHIARIHGKLDRQQTERILRQAWEDEEAYVRGHAEDAGDDIAHFLGWEIRH